VNERTSKIRWLAVGGVIIVLVAIGVSYFALRPRPYPLLDSRLGASAWQPTNLIEILSWEYHADNQNPFGLGHGEFSDFQHQALLRLIDVQGAQFGHRAPRGATSGTFIDHSFAHVSERTNSRVVVLGTGTLEPVHFERSSVHGSDPYWQMERFTFTLDGDLLSRESYTQ
jgi:hypothetical protein